MPQVISVLLLLLLLLQQNPASGQVQLAAEEPTYTSGGELNLPARYREWVFLSSGVDMSYSPNPAMAGHSMFDNVFVNPASYRVFQQTGTWPDRTTFVLEIRGAEGPSSINKRGHSQSEAVMGTEIHVKDARLEGGWGFYEFDTPAPAKILARTAACYQCHQDHGAVDHTFVQFYPTLLGIARSKGTLSPAYLKEIPAPAAAAK